MDVIRPLQRPGSVRGPAEWFTGEVWLDPIVRGEEPSRVRVNAVHFTPGARTAWHCHVLGQTLYVTEGEGRIQAAGGEVLLDRLEVGLRRGELLDPLLGAQVVPVLAAARCGDRGGQCLRALLVAQRQVDLALHGRVGGGGAGVVGRGGPGRYRARVGDGRRAVGCRGAAGRRGEQDECGRGGAGE